MATTVQIPLALSTVNVNNANVFWTVKDGTNYDYGYLAFADGASGSALFWGLIPTNVAATPAWNLILHHARNAGGGAGNNVVLTVKAKDFANSDAIDAALTALHTTATFAVDTTALDLTITTLSGTNYDATEAVEASRLLMVEITRVGANAGDTIDTQWNLLAVMLRIDIA